jgi:hypothetical protein
VANAKKILITTESHETFILRITDKKRAFGRCSECKQEVELMTVDRAVSVSGIRTSEVIRRIGTNEIHGIETESGHLLVCGESLLENRRPKGDGNE